MRTRAALVIALLAVLSLAGCVGSTPGTAGQTTAARTPTPTPTVQEQVRPTPSVSAAPIDLVAGFDAQLAWSLCLAKGQEDNPGSMKVYPYALSQVTANPSGESVTARVAWQFEAHLDAPGNIFTCRIGGSPDNPVVESIYATDAG